MQVNLKIIFPFCFVLWTYTISCQNLVHPESIIYDTKRDSYFISDAATGIIYIKKSEDLAAFTKQGTGSHGLAIKDNFLLACYENRINILDIVSGRVLISYKIQGANFLKNICLVDEIAYVTDFTRRNIYEVNLSNPYDPKSEIFSHLDKVPSGLSYDPGAEVLIFSTWGKNGKLFTIGLKNKEQKLVKTTNLVNLNGLLYKPGVGYFSSSWSPQAVWWFPIDVNPTPLLITEEVFKPSGLVFDAANLLTILNTGSGTFTEIERFKNQANRSTELNVHAFPNPVVINSLLTFELIEEMELNIRVYDCQGRFVEQIFEGRKSKGPQTILFEPNKLPNGIYYVDFQSDLWKKAISLTVVR